MDFLFNTNAQFFIAAYLVGGIPFGLLLAKKFAGVDVKSSGSKSIGATNVLRVVKETNPSLAKKLGAATLALDAIKGVLVLAVAYFMGLSEATLWGISVLAVIGHCYSPYLGFEGGKGVATACGILFGINWILGAATLSTWIIVAMFMRYSSLAALAAAVFGPIYFVFLFGFQPMGIALLIVSLLLVWRHRSNIQNLLNGTEGRIGSKKKSP